MNFDLTSEQKLLKDTIRDFAENEIAPKNEELDLKEEFSYDLTAKMAQLGLFGITASPDYGGQGLDYLSLIIIVEELARVSASQAATVGVANSLGIKPIEQFGSKEQKEKYLPDLCSGKKLWSFGLTEPDAGSDAANTNTTAELKNGQWIINGSKIFITNSTTDISWGSTVQCCTGKRPDGKKELSCILVENGTHGFTTKTMHKKMCWRASNTGELYFSDVAVPKENLLGKKGDGFKLMLAALDSGRLVVAAMGLGGSVGAYEAALKYSKQRKQFGKYISTFQANAFKLADCATEIEAARSLLYRTCWLKDNGRPFTTEAAMAKLFCSEVMARVTNHALQIHGGYGLIEEYPAARFYRDHKLLEIGEGTSEIQRLVISRKIGCFDVEG